MPRILGVASLPLSSKRLRVQEDQSRLHVVQDLEDEPVLRRRDGREGCGRRRLEQGDGILRLSTHC